MAKQTSRFESITAIINGVAIMANLVWIASYTRFENFDPACIWGILPWLGLSIATFFINRLFMSKARSVQSIVMLNAVLFAVTLAVLLQFFKMESGFAYFLFGVIVAASTALSCSVCLGTPVLRKVVNRLDISVILSVVFIWLYSNINIPGEFMLVMPIAVMANFTCVIFRRITNDGQAIYKSKYGGIAAIVAIVLLLFAVLAVFMLLFSGLIGSGASAAVNGFMTALKAIASALTAFFVFMAKFFPNSESEMGPIEQQPNTSIQEDAELGQQLAQGNFIFFVVIALILIGIFVLFLIARKLKTSGGITVEKKKKVTVTATKTSLLEALKKFFKQLSEKITFALNLTKNKNTSAGVYIYINRYAALSSQKRNADETPRIFLNRLAESYIADEENDAQNVANDLNILANDLEKQFYSEEKTSSLTKEQLKNLRQTMNTYLHKKILKSNKKDKQN